MKTILLSCVYALLHKGNCDLQDLQKFMLDEPDLINYGCNLSNEIHRNFFLYKFQDNEIKRTKSALYRRIQELLVNPPFARMILGKSTINLRKSLSSNKVLVFDLSGIGESSKFYMAKLIVAQVKAIAQTRDRLPPEFRPTTYLYLDEFQEYISASFSWILTGARKYHLYVIGAHQFLNQLGNQLENVLSNCKVKVMYRNFGNTITKLSPYF